jgi:hypothetical protein
VATFVNQKKIFKLANNETVFEQEIQILQEERKQKTQSSIIEFENERQKLEADRKKLNEDYTDQIVQNIKKHEENKRKIDESKSELNKINQKYSIYSRKIEESISSLRSGQKLEVVRQLHIANKNIFINSINQQLPLNFINGISTPNLKTELRQSLQPSQYKSFEENSFSHEQKRWQNRKLAKFKLLTFILFLLWIGTLIYHLTFTHSETNDIDEQPHEKTIPIIESPKAESIPLKELNPKPNSELSLNDYKIVAKKISKDMPINEIVQIIFEANPTEIRNNYSAQIELYTKMVYERNKDCFKVDSTKYYFIKDTLRHIPSYKK